VQLESRYRKGQTIGGRYHVHQALAGGMGEVYLCFDIQDMLPFALKSFQARYLTSPKAREYFEREAATWVKLEKHPNVVRCFYMTTVDHTPFLFLEWVAGAEGDGTDLRDWLDRRGPLEPRRALEFTLDVCRALVHAQKKVPGLVHCDIKPENVLVAQGQLAKLTDFGLAKVVREAGLVPPGEAAPAAGGRWQVSSAGGTPPYMAPEQWRGESVDARTDVYAVGCLLYELLSGRWPFQANSLDDLKRRHLGAPPPRLEAGLGGMRGGGLDALLARCLAKEPGGRYPSASELLGAIAALYESWHGAPPRGVPDPGVFSALDYTNRAATYSALGRHKEALSDCGLALEIDPTYVQAYANRGAAYTALGSYSEALMDFANALQLDPNVSGVYINRASAYSAMGCDEKAMADFNYAISVDPNEARTYFNRALHSHNQRRYSEALADLNRALEIDPKFAEAYYRRGNAYSSLGYREEALADYVQTLQLDPRNAEAYIRRGLIFSASGSVAQGLDDFRRALDIDPDNTDAYTARGMTNAMLGQHAEAISDYDQVLRLDPESAQAYSMRGLANSKLGRLGEALSDYTKALELDPTNIDSYINRGVTYQTLGHPVEALSDYTQAIKLDPNNSDAYINIGAIHHDRGEWADALRAFETAARLGNTIGAQYASHVRQMLGESQVPVPVDPAQQAFEAFQNVDSAGAMRKLVEQYPLLVQAHVLAAIERAIVGQVPPRDLPAFRQRLGWLHQIAEQLQRG